MKVYICNTICIGRWLLYFVITYISLYADSLYRALSVYHKGAKPNCCIIVFFLVHFLFCGVMASREHVDQLVTFVSPIWVTALLFCALFKAVYILNFGMKASNVKICYIWKLYVSVFFSRCYSSEAFCIYLLYPIIEICIRFCLGSSLVFVAVHLGWYQGVICKSEWLLICCCL